MKTKQIAMLLGLVTLTTGCALGGRTEFTCPDPQNGVCVDAHEAFLLAEQGKTAEDFKKGEHLGHGSKSEERDDEDHEHETASSTSQSDEDNAYRDVAPVAGLMSQPIDQPKPIRMPATILQVWIKPFEDSDGALHMATEAFAEITPRRWSLTNTTVEEFKTLGPFVTTDQ
jgi:conjugal transfer pilus assembly protein TraV